MKKQLTAVLASAMLLTVAAGCSNTTTQTVDAGSAAPSESQSTTTVETTEPIVISVGVPTAPPALPILHMMEAQLLGENVTIQPCRPSWNPRSAAGAWLSGSVV